MINFLKELIQKKLVNIFKEVNISDKDCIWYTSVLESLNWGISAFIDCWNLGNSKNLQESPQRSDIY